MTKLCNSCGKENADDAKFCLSCGNKFDIVVTESDQTVKVEQAATEAVKQESVNSAPQPNQEVSSAAANRAKTTKINFRPSNYQWFDFQNPIAMIMYGIGGLIFIGGFILGIIMGFVQYNNYYDYYSEHTMFSFSTTLYYWLRAFISGTAIVAVGEIINVLQKILNKTK